MPPDDTISVPPDQTVVWMVSPPDETIPVPPLRIIVPLSKLLFSAMSLPPLLTSILAVADGHQFDCKAR